MANASSCSCPSTTPISIGVPLGDTGDCRGTKLGDAVTLGLAVLPELRANVDMRLPAADLNCAEPSCPLAGGCGEPCGTGGWGGVSLGWGGGEGSTLGRKQRDMKSIEYLRQ